MKLPTASAVLALLLLVLPAASAGSNDGNHLVKVTVTAWVDGRDLLYITPSSVHWQHLDLALPGKRNANYPTGFVMANVDPDLALVMNWFPRWKCPPENPGCYSLEVDSSILPLGMPLPSEYQLTDFQVQQGRSSLTVYQYPSLSNDYTTILDFNDDLWGGADWYAAQLTFAPLD